MNSTLIGAARLPLRETSTESAAAAILVVDDDEAVRSMLARTLQHLGYAVVQCESGERAVSIIEADGVPFDLVICDTFLGGMNGDETARLIGQLRPELPLITVSGYPRSVPDASGANPKRYFLSKPFRTQALSALVLRALARA
jgi:CheY-like chemotaxis protein